MRTKSYSPGLTYYLMAALLLVSIVYACGLALEAWSVPPEQRAKVYLTGLVASVLLVLLLLGWHSFILRSDGLAVRDLRGRRLHRWENLGKPSAKEFVHGSKDSILLSMDGMRGGSDPQAFSHHIRDARGKTLYHVGPWYPQRRELMRELRRGLRENR